MKRVEYLQRFTLVINNKSGVTNRGADALSKRYSLLTEMNVEVVGFDETWKECKAPSLTEQPSKFDEYFIVEGMLFKGI